MLTIKQILDDKEAVIRGLEKKHFANAREVIEQVLAIDNKRKTAQSEADRLRAEMNGLSKSIGGLMKEKKVAEAEEAKQKVASLKEQAKVQEDTMKSAEEERTQLLYTIPNVPYDIVPEGNGAEDNVVVKTGGHDLELPQNALPHWELAKKYNLIDFDLGVKITGRRFPGLHRLGSPPAACVD